MELTTSEKDTLRAYREWFTQHGVEPSYRQLARVLGVDYSAVRYSLKRMVVKGYMKERPVTQIRLTLNAKGKKVEL